MGLPENQIEWVRMAALLHDIGKMYVPSEILTKPGQISDLETGIIDPSFANKGSRNYNVLI